MTQQPHLLESGFVPLPLAPEPPAPEPSATAPPYSAPIAYFKRFKMEAELQVVMASALPEGFRWRPWQPDADLLALHADTLFHSFHAEIDAQVFASLGDPEGCRSLMSSIVFRSGFLPSATWLLLHDEKPVGTVQGIHERRGLGAIQNLGVLPGYRGLGLGVLLMQQAMVGFLQAGLSRVSLEVTAQNERALQLYRRLGFRRVKTIYKAVPVSLIAPRG